MEVWKKLDNEPEKQYQAFLLYLEDVKNRNSLSNIAESFQVRPATVNNWKHKYDWIERAEAYDRDKEKEVDKKRSILFKEHAYNLNEGLIDYIKLLMISKDIYMDKLNSGGLEELKNKNIDDIREILYKDADLMARLTKVQKEVLGLVPEGRDLIEEEKKGDKVVIHIESVTNNYNTSGDKREELEGAVEQEKIEYEEAKVEEESKED